MRHSWQKIEEGKWKCKNPNCGCIKVVYGKITYYQPVSSITKDYAPECLDWKKEDKR